MKRAGVADEVYDFIAERLRGLLLEQPGTDPEMLDAVLANRPRSPLDAVARLAGVERVFAVAGCRRARGNQQAHREYSQEDASERPNGRSILQP